MEGNMERINKQAIEQLLRTKTKPLVTIYVPMHATASPSHISENQIRLKNLIHKATELLRAEDQGEALAQQLDEKFDELSSDPDFWATKTPGLLICAGLGSLRIFNLPVDTEEYVAVDIEYHLAPILALVNDQQSFYVLLVAQHTPKLFIGNMYGLRISNVKLPANLRQGLDIDEPNQKTENQGSASGSSLNTGWFNGRGGARNPGEEDRMRFWRLIDKTLKDKTDNILPLILAGIDAETVEYRAISKYPQILQGTISGSHSDAHMPELFNKAVHIVRQEILEPERLAAVQEYRRLHGVNPERTADTNQTIEQAAHQGRIDKLLATMSRYTTDTIRDKVQTTLQITFPEPQSSQLLNRIATKVWQMSGTIINTQPDEITDGATMVARLRY